MTHAVSALAEVGKEPTKKGDKSEAVRAFISEHGNLPAPQIKKALMKQGVVVSLPQIYNVKRALEPKPLVQEIDLPDSVPLAELNEVLEFSKRFRGGIKRLKQVVDVIWSFKHC
jgi:Fe2+ or Zn2+ uptake regulation protein